MGNKRKISKMTSEELQAMDRNMAREFTRRAAAANPPGLTTAGDRRDFYTPDEREVERLISVERARRLGALAARKKKS